MLMIAESYLLESFNLLSTSEILKAFDAFRVRGKHQFYQIESHLEEYMIRNQKELPLNETIELLISLGREREGSVHLVNALVQRIVNSTSEPSFNKIHVNKTAAEWELEAI